MDALHSSHLHPWEPTCLGSLCQQLDLLPLHPKSPPISFKPLVWVSVPSHLTGLRATTTRLGRWWRAGWSVDEGVTDVAVRTVIAMKLSYTACPLWQCTQTRYSNGECLAGSAHNLQDARPNKQNLSRLNYIWRLIYICKSTTGSRQQTIHLWWNIFPKCQLLSNRFYFLWKQKDIRSYYRHCMATPNVSWYGNDMYYLPGMSTGAECIMATQGTPTHSYLLTTPWADDLKHDLQDLLDVASDLSGLAGLAGGQQICKSCRLSL